MSAESNIILITNDNSVEQILKPKLILLREIDNVLLSKYTDAIGHLKAERPDVILLYCSNDKDECLSLIKKIKLDDLIKRTSILLIVDKYDQDFLLSAYDEGIADYISVEADDAEILMRTIWCIKKSLLLNTIQKQHNLLEKLDVVDKITGFYTNEHCDKIFRAEFDNIKTHKFDAVFMLIAASEESKTTLASTDLAKAIKNSTRKSDIISHGNANRFYVLLPETNLKGAFCVWGKIKKTVGEAYSLNVGLGMVGEKTLETLKVELLNALIEAFSTGKESVIMNEESKGFSTDWLKKINSTQKNFKLFKQAFDKKLDKVITPVFFQMQKSNEDKLFETQIEQYSNATLSSFRLKRENQTSELKITYPGFSKVNVDIIHQGLDSPENKRISLDLTELSESSLTQILQEFIQEFKLSGGE